MTQYTFAQCGRRDEAVLADFIMTVKDELYLPDRAAVTAMLDLLYREGGICAVYDRDTICGVLGFFYGEPARDFGNKEVVFLYVAAIAPAYRLSRVFHYGLLSALRAFQRQGKREIRLQAEAANPYTNKLYSRFAACLYPGYSLRGVPVNTYGGEITQALAALNGRRRAARRRPDAVPVS